MRIPKFDDPRLNEFLVQWELEQQRIRKDMMTSISGNRALLLYSPSKKVYEVTVDDAGVLTTTKVAG